MLLLFLGEQLGRAATNDEPHTLAELNAWYQEPPTNQNAASFYLKAFAALEVTNDFESSVLPWIGKAELVVPGKAFTPEFKSALDELLRRNAAVFEFCEEGARFEHSRYAVDISPKTRLPHLRDLQLTVKLLAVRGLSLANAHEAPAAADNLLVTVRLIRSLEQEPITISQSTRSRCLYYVMKELEEIINRVALPKQSWEDVERVIDQIENDDAKGVHYARALAGERVMTSHFFEIPLTDQLLLFWNRTNETRAELELLLEKNPRSDDLKFLAAGFEEIQKCWSEPYPSRLFAVSETRSARSREAAKQNYLLSEVVFSSNEYWTSREASGLAYLRLAKTAMALERYRAEHHDTFPQLLSDLTPKNLPKPLIDPFNGKPFQYRRIGNGYTLQSVGPPDTFGETSKRAKGKFIFAVINPPRSSKP